MKFDKFMNFCFKGLCLCLACIILAGFCFSCFGSPIKACAFTPAPDNVTGAQWIAQWREEAEEHFNEVENAVLEDIKNGNLDSSSVLAKQYLNGMLLQFMAFNNPAFAPIFHSADLVLQGIPDSYFEDNPTVSVSGSISGGYCYKNGDSNLHMVFCYYGSSLICDSDFFSISVFPADSGGSFAYPASLPSNCFGVFISNSGYSRITYSDSLGYFSNFTTGSAYYTCSVYGKYDSSSIPTLYSGSLNNYLSVNSQPSSSLCGSGSSVVLPNGTIDSIAPYDYYNNYVLPYIQENYPTMPDEYIMFPDGWAPQDPVEPSTVPNGGIFIDKQINIGINIFTPTDANGQPITDESGETVTETQYVTATYPPDGEYRFQIPTIEPLNLYQSTIPNPDLSPFTDGFSFIWNATYHFFNDTGFMPVVIACLSLSVIGYIIWKVGG